MFNRITAGLFICAALIGGLVMTRGVVARRHEQAQVQERRREVGQIFAAANKLKPGMTEDQVAKVLGSPYFKWGFASTGSGTGANELKIFQAPDNQDKFLVLEYQFKKAAGHHDFGRVDPKTGQEYFCVLRKVRLGNTPY
jgi:hypothetical protein